MHATLDSRLIGDSPPRFTATPVVGAPDVVSFDAGYVSPYFVTEPETMEAVLDSPLILIYDRPISSRWEFLPLLGKVVRAGRSLLVIAAEVEGDALATLVVNKISGVLPCVAVKLPATEGARGLEDLARACGAHPSAGDGLPLEFVSLQDLGQAMRVVVTGARTSITALPVE